MSNIKISYIIPVKNAQKTICSAINSINKSFTNLGDYEIIIVADSIFDSTLNALKNIHQKNIIIKIPNKSCIAKSRNLGVSTANGEYIAFLDADDTLFYNGKDFYLKMVSKGYDCFFGQPSLTSNEDLCKEGLVEGKNDLDIFFAKPTLTSALWEYYTKKEIIINNKITFNENLIRDEDGPFCAKIICSINSLYLTGKYFVNYTINEKSLSKLYSLQHLISIEQSYEDIYKILLSKDYSKSLIRWGNNFVDIFLYYVATKTSKKERAILINIIKGSDCINFIKITNRTKPKMIYNLFGLKIGMTIMRLFRG